MIEKKYDTVIIGGGAAGLAAAETTSKAGLKTALIEREDRLGGILNQCIHNGFGLHFFKEELTGPEYAHRFIHRVTKQSKIDIFLNTTVVDMEKPTPQISGKEKLKKIIYGYSAEYGVLKIKTPSVILAMGSRERNRGNIGIPGTRPAGVFTAGLVQRCVNIEGYKPGDSAVIIGSGDIGLIMARRLTWIGVKVKAVIEIQPYPSGLTRNIVQCLNDFNIPLYLSHVVSRIYGNDRVEGVEVTPIEEGKLNTDKTFKIECDTLLLSVGLIPENELSKKIGVRLNPETGGAFVDAHLMTSIDGIFSCGNVLHIHDLVDFVTEEAVSAANFAIKYIDGKITRGIPETETKCIDTKEEQAAYPTEASANVKYIIPNSYDPSQDNKFFMRPLIVKNNARLVIKSGKEIIKEKKLIHIQPSEMISITIREKDFQKVNLNKDSILEFSIQ